MAAHLNPDPDQPPDPWYRSSAALWAAGVAGLALVGGLVFTVITMSDQWSRPTTSTVRTTVPTTGQTLRTTEPFIATPSYETSSSFPTSVQLSTTEIGVPDESTTESSPSESPTTTRTPRTSRTQDSDQTTTTSRNRPRLNQTRTLSP
ncbi:MAG: hypothetical protein WBB07_27740 [Mycobacterium sp.]